MGVKGLWKVIESAGVPVPLETLENKVLGVDVSIWLHQAVRGFRGPGGAATANAHLLTLFHRICKLLFYRIRPVFVFDGGVPHLKKQTLASRKLRRDVATNRAKQVRERLFQNLLKSQAVRTALGRSGSGPSSVHVPKVTKKEKDLFELPPLSEALGGEGNTESHEEEENSNIVLCDNLPNLHQFDLESEEFQNLPLDMKHEILSELQSTRKQNSWASINDMPQQSENFADFQMARLMKRAKFQATLDSTREEIQKAKVSEMEVELFGELEKYTSHSRRIISEDASHAIYVKKVKETETSRNNPEPIDADSHEPNKKIDKGKTLLRKNKTIDKDFLTELAKVGVIRPDSDSDSDVESDSFHLVHSSGESGGYNSRQHCSEEEDYFIQAVGSLMENSGLTQEEILTMIKQDQNENANEYKNEVYDGPSTSANASGSIYKPDDSSSDDDSDSFIEVSNDVQFPQVEKEGEQKELTANNNIDKLLGTKTNSLWMKIVQQKVDDMVQVNTLKTSPKKAIIDSRNMEKDLVTLKDSMKHGKENVTRKEHIPSKDVTETLSPVKISLDFEVKPLKMEDNIFSDIFADLCQPPPLKILQEGQGVRQSIDAQNVVKRGIRPDRDCNSQSGIGYNKGSISAESNFCETSDVREHGDILPNITPLPNTGNVVNDNAGNNVKSICLERRLSAEKDEVSHDEVEIMSSSDDTDDEQAMKISIPSSPSHVESMKSQSQSKTQPGNQNVHVLQQTSHKSSIFSDKNSSFQSSKRIVLENADCNAVTTLMENTGCIDKPTNGKTLESLQLPVLKDKNINNIQQPELNSSDQTTDVIPKPPLKSQFIDNERSTSRSQPLGSSTVDGNLMEEVTVSGVETNMKGKKHGQEEGTLPQTSDHPDNRPEIMRNYDGLTDKKGIIINNIEQKDVDISEGSIDEGKLYSDTDDMEILETNAVESEVQDTKVEKPLDYTEDELKHLEGELASEQHALVAQAQQYERLASSLNDQMYGESQHLLQLFGIPYLVAPMEAEAQCAFLNIANLTEGTITDDSDIFLFGGNSVYRNFFNQTRHVEFFKTDNIKSTLGLERSKMITLALLCGSDYTVGVEGIGSVGALEVLAEFPGEGIECLNNVRKWWSVASNGVHRTQLTKIKQKLTQVNLPDSFPNENVYEAYLAPEVDESRAKFTWAVPNVEALRSFTGEKFGWNATKTDEILLPVMKKLKIRTSQKRIESYFTNIKLVKEPKIASKRMQDAISKAKGTTLSDTNPATGHSFTQVKAKKREQKRKGKKEIGGKQVIEGNEQNNCEVVSNTQHSKPKGTLLVDPSDIKKKPVVEGRKGQKRKKETREEDKQASQNETEIHETSPKKRTKESMFKHLLEKEIICQKEKEKLEMQEKKKNAAIVLQKNMKIRKR